MSLYQRDMSLAGIVNRNLYSERKLFGYFYETLLELTKEKTIIMIAHRLKTVRHADQIVVVDQGKITQQGTHEELMKRDGIYRRFVDSRELAVSWKI